MSQEQTSGQQDSKASGEESTQTTQTTDATVPKSHADKLLAEKKKIAEEKKALQDRLDAIEREKLEKEGKTQELVDKYKKDLEGERESNKTLKNTIVQRTVKAALKSEAEKSGLNIPFDKFEKLVDFSSIDVDSETLEVSEKDLKAAVVKMKAEMPMIFKTTVTPPNDLNPSGGNNSPGAGKPLSEMTEAELTALLAKTKK